jgi:hypothetical protein
MKALPKNESPKRRSLFGLIYVLAGIAAVSLIVWQITPSLSSHATAPKPDSVAKATVQPPAKAIGLIPPTPKGNDSSISPEPLKLILVQVHPGRNATEGSADLGVVRESPQTYQAGALLENGARLVEIYSDYVVLDKDGRSARLYLENATTVLKAGNAAVLSVGGAVEKPAPAKITSREVLTDYVRPSPVYDGQNLVGFQVYPGSKSTPFHQMGLQGGDVLVEVNGVPLTDPTTSWDLLRGLADGAVLSVVVKRGTGLQQVILDGTLLVIAEESQRQGTVQAALAPPIQ